jgi:hypothetical protein
MGESEKCQEGVLKIKRVLGIEICLSHKSSNIQCISVVVELRLNWYKKKSRF